MNYQKFKLDQKDIFLEAYNRCLKEMYKRAQPSVNYDDLVKDHKQRMKEGLEPVRYYERYYLSNEEFKYILNKYISAYRFNETFRPNIDLIIDNFKHGYTSDLYIKGDKNHPGYNDYEHKPALKEVIGEENADKVIEILKDRKDFYRFDRDASDFSVNVALGASPTTNEQTVIDYWRSQGKKITINPRHYSDDYFWEEENGYSHED